MIIAKTNSFKVKDDYPKKLSWNQIKSIHPLNFPVVRKSDKKVIGYILLKYDILDFECEYDNSGFARLTVTELKELIELVDELKVIFKQQLQEHYDTEQGSHRQP